MDPGIFFDYSSRTGLFRCRVTGNPCGSDTTLVGVECPMGKDHPCPNRVAFQAGWEAAYAVNFPPEVEITIDCGLCHNTGWMESEKWGRVRCGMCGRHPLPHQGHS